MRIYSIIIVTLNDASGLRKTLLSVRQQSYQGREVIVIDGASNDNTLDIAEQNKDVISTIISEKDEGVYNAMNKGLQYATGDYVIYMNSGDTFADDDTLSLVNNFDGHLILGSAVYGGQLRKMKDHMSLYDILSIGINHQSTYYRTDIIKRYPFDESLRIIADLKSVVEPMVREKINPTCITDILSICEAAGLSKKRWREAKTERDRIVEEVIDPFYLDDYRQFSRVSNSMLPEFIVLSQFNVVFPALRLLCKILRWYNKNFKHIPL